MAARTRASVFMMARMVGVGAELQEREEQGVWGSGTLLFPRNTAATCLDPWAGVHYAREPGRDRKSVV